MPELDDTYSLIARSVAIDTVRMRKYRVMPRQYQEMLLAQNEVCAICGNKETAKINGRLRSLAIDHNHETGEVRGLLCGHCNRALGLLREDSEIIKSMLQYLEEHSEVSA